MNRRVLRVCGFAVGSAVSFHSASFADTIIYKETCELAHDHWDMTCKIDRDTLSDQSYIYPKVKFLSFCATFDNHGGFNAPASIIHNGDDGEQSKPTDMFDTVKFQGNQLSNRITWIGSGSRRGAGWTMRGDFRLLTESEKGRTGVYSETLWQGQRLLGEIHSTCRQNQE
jgi:hypothetical protein